MTAKIQDQPLLLVGTYTRDCESDGIYVFRFDAQTADCKLHSATRNITSPSFLSISPGNENIYCVNESGGESTVSAFSLDLRSGRIVFLNKHDSGGASPCYVVDDRKNVIVANYDGGSIAVFGKADGSLSHLKQLVAHHGSGPNRERQEKPHVHMVAFSPDGNYVLATDLGTDELYVYNYFQNAAENVLTLKNKVAVKPGSGPRHLAFSPDGKIVYLLHELDGTVSVFEYCDGRLNEIQQTSVVQNGFDGETAAGDILCSADGKFVYATNRGDANTISVFSTGSDRKLTHLEMIATKGDSPRSIALTPDGRFLLIGHENSDIITIFSREAKSGKLRDTGKKIALCAPVCLKFIAGGQRFWDSRR